MLSNRHSSQEKKRKGLIIQKKKSTNHLFHILPEDSLRYNSMIFLKYFLRCYLFKRERESMSGGKRKRKKQGALLGARSQDPE